MSTKEYRFGFFIDGNAAGGVQALRQVRTEAASLEQQANKARVSTDQWRNSTDTLGRQLGTMKGMIVGLTGALGVTLSVNFFAGLMNDSIDLADHLNDLRKTTGLTVESLAGLNLAAEQTGSDLDATAKVIDLLSKNIGKNAEKYRELGITARDPLEAFKQLADLYVSMEDPQERAATMAELIGRNWEAAAPMLAEGSAAIQQMVDRGAQLSSITTEMAEGSDQFNDAWSDLTATLDGYRNRGVAALLPMMTDLLQATQQFVESGELALWADRAVIALEGLAVVFAARLIPQLLAYNVAVPVAIAESIRYQQALATMAGASTVAATRIGALNGMVALSASAFRTGLSSALMLFGGPAGATFIAVAGIVALISAMENLQEREARLRAEMGKLTAEQIRQNIAIAQSELEAANASKARAERRRDRSAADERAYQAEAARVSQITSRLHEYTRALDDAEQAKVDIILTGMIQSRSDEEQATAVRGFTEAERDSITAIALKRAQLAMSAREAAIFGEVWKAYSDGAGPDAIRTIAQTTGALFDQEAAAKAAADAETQRQKGLKDQLEDLNKIYSESGRFAEESFERQQAASRQAAEQAANDWRDFRNTFSDGFADLMMESGNVFDTIAKSFERMLYKMAGDLLASGVMSFLTGKGGGFSIGGALQGSGTTGMLTSAALSKFAPGLAKSLGIGSLVGGAAAAPAGALTAEAYVSMMGSTMAPAAGGGGLMAGLGTALKAIPGWGWALAGVAALGTMFSQKSTPSWNAGLLLDPSTPLGKSGRSFQTEAFASGLQPLGFYRRSSQAEAEQVIDLFRDLDQAIVDLAGKGNLRVSASGIRGLNEEGLGSGSVLGLAGQDGKPGMAIEQQLDNYARQLIGSLAGQLDDAVLSRVLGAGDAAAMLNELEAALTPLAETSTTTAEAVTSSANALAVAAEKQVEVERRAVEARGDLILRYSTDAEKLAYARQQISDAFAAFGVAVPNSVAELRSLVASIDPLSTRGQEALQALNGLSGAIDIVIEASEQQAAAVREQAEAERERAEEERRLMQSKSDLVLQYSSDAEKLAFAKTQISEAFERFGVAVPNSIAELRELITTINPLTERGQEAMLALNGLSNSISLVAGSAEKERNEIERIRQEGFNATLNTARRLADEAERNAEAAASPRTQTTGSTAVDQTLATRQRWQDELDLILGTKTQSQLELERDLAGVTDAATRTLIERVHAERDSADADRESTRVLTERTRWQEQLDLMLGRRTQHEIDLERDLANVTDTATRSLITQIYAQRLLNKTAEEAADAARAEEQRIRDLAARGVSANGVLYNPDALLQGRIAQVAFSRYGNNQGQIGIKNDSFFDFLTGEYIPGYASGGNHRGGVRIVGEHGPEIEVTRPSHIMSNVNSGDFLQTAADNAKATRAMKEEMQGLRQDVGKLITAVEQVAVNTGEGGRALGEAIRQGKGKGLAMVTV